MAAFDAGAVARPAPAPSRWRLLRQISLRTCLILLTLGCIGLAVVSQRAREQRLAVERVLALGGSVAYDEGYDAKGHFRQSPHPPPRQWLRDMIGQGYLEQVRTVDLDKSGVSDADMQVIGKLRGVRTLNLNDTSVSDDGLEAIRSWRKLTYLGLMKSQVTSRGLRHLEELQSLDSLILENTSVNDDGAASIAKLRSLKTLSLGGTKITSASIPPLSSLLLDILALSQTQVDDAAISHLCQMKTLNWLMLDGSRVSGEGLLQLRDALPACQLDGELVDLTSWPPGDVPDGAWSGILLRLRPLHDEGRLKLIDASGIGIADRHLQQLDGFTKLQMLDLRETRVTDAGVESLRQSLPGCKIAR